MTCPWTEAHRREALRRTYEIGAELVADDGDDHRAYLLLETGTPYAGGRVDREVRRVRALAEGRLVRDTGWRVGREWYAAGEEARDRRQAYPGMPLLRVTRIRRAP